MMTTTTYSELAIGSLNPLQRLLLTSDGTLTEMLEAANLEPIGLRILDQQIRPADRYFDLLDLCAGDSLMRRQVLLRGTRTGQTYVHGESLIAIDRFSDAVQRDLLISNTPLGPLFKQHRMETFKEILYRGAEPAGELAPFFAIGGDDLLLVRTFRVFLGGKPAMLITEHISPEDNSASGEK